MLQADELRHLLNDRVSLYNKPAFIERDPIIIPHSFRLLQDVEIAGFFAATLAWGNRTSIINSCRKLLAWMDNAPYDFVINHHETDLKRFLSFAHRTFNATDLLYFISFLQQHYNVYSSLEDAFVPGPVYEGEHTQEALTHFHNYFFAGEHPARTRKHVATPMRNSACKRLSMFLRWMVRKDDAGVDFGLWTKIAPAQLVCPLDVHVARVAHRLGLIDTMKTDWKNALALIERLREFNDQDPVIYDYALFSLGIEERF